MKLKKRLNFTARMKIGFSAEDNRRIHMYDTVLSDFPRELSDESDAQRIQRAIDVTENGILYIPGGKYEIDQPLFIHNRCSLKMHPAARLIAVKEMDFVLTYQPTGDYHCLTLFEEDRSVYDNLGLFIEGGDIDGNGLASCFGITNAHHFTLENITFHNGKRYGLYIGGDLGGHIYELVCNNVYCKCTMKGLSGNVGIWSDKCDAHFNDCFVIDYTVGIRLLGFSNRLTRCHLWGGTVPPENYSMEEWSGIYGERKKKLFSGVYGAEAANGKYDNDSPEMLLESISFDIAGGGNVLDGCYADTAKIGYRINGDTRLIGCDFFNNQLMGLKKSTAILHLRGTLVASLCRFTATVGTEKLYEGSGENVIWDHNIAGGFKEKPWD